MVKSECPAWGKACNSCCKPNHFAGAEVCKSGKTDVKSDKSDCKSKGSADSSSGSKTPAKSSKRSKYPKKSVHMVDDESSDLSTESSVSVVTDVSAVHNDKARPLFYKMEIAANIPSSIPYGPQLGPGWAPIGPQLGPSWAQLGPSWECCLGW